MILRDLLRELLARLGANGGASTFIEAQELSEWPVAAVAVVKAEKLLVRARSAASIVCRGCERQCVMPVHVIPANDRSSGAFVVCDKRSDINRVNVPIEHLEQWQMSAAAVADWIARVLDLRRPRMPQGDAKRWEVAMLKRAKHASHLVLLADGELKLTLGGHSIVLTDVLDVKGDRIAIDRRTLNRCVDHPLAGAGDAESAEQRRKRLKARVQEEKSKGTRGYLKLVAAEEGISTSRLKQLVKSLPLAATAWSALARPVRTSISTRRKGKY